MEENELLDEYREAYKAFRKIDDLIELGLVPKEELEATTAKRDAAQQELKKISQALRSKGINANKATQQAINDRTEDLKNEYIAAFEAVEEAEELFNADGNDDNKIRLEDAQKRLNTAKRLLKGMYLDGKDEFSKFTAPLVSGKEERRAKRAKEAAERAGVEEPEKPAEKPAKEAAEEPVEEPGKEEPAPVPGTEQEPKAAKGKTAETPGKDDKTKPEISEDTRAKMDKYAEEFSGHVKTYMAVTMKDVKAAVDFCLKDSLKTLSNPMDPRDRDLREQAGKLESRGFKTGIAKENLKDAFLDILARAEDEFPPEVVEVLKNELNTYLKDTLKKEYEETFDDKTIEVLKANDKDVSEERKYYETHKEKIDSSRYQEISKKIGQAAAILQAIEEGRSDLLGARTSLITELNRQERKRESFRSSLEEPNKEEEAKEGGTKEEAKEEGQPKEGTPEYQLVSKFNEVKSTLFNQAVAARIDPKTFKYTMDKYKKPVLIVHVENDGIRTADGKVNKTIATVVVTENSVRKISEYVETVEPGDYYQSLTEGKGDEEYFKANKDKLLGPEGIDMRPVDKDGKKVEDAQQVPMLAESLVTTKTGMQQLVVNTPKGISAIAVGAKTKALSYEQKQEIELFTEQQKEIALGVKKDLLDNHKTGLGNKIQNPDAPEGASTISVEAESNLEDFFKILSTDKDRLAVGGTGNFKRDSSGEKIVKQNFMTFVFDKYDKENTKIEDGKDPKPLQFTITERDANGKDTSTTYILGADGKYYDVEAVKAATKMADIDSKGVEAAVILNRAGTLGIGSKFVTNVIRRDSDKAINDKEKDQKIEEAGLSQYRVDGDKINRHINQSELSLHKQAKRELAQAKQAQKTAEKGNNTREDDGSRGA